MADNDYYEISMLDWDSNFWNLICESYKKRLHDHLQPVTYDPAWRDEEWMWSDRFESNRTKNTTHLERSISFITSDWTRWVGLQQSLRETTLRYDEPVKEVPPSSTESLKWNYGKSYDSVPTRWCADTFGSSTIVSDAIITPRRAITRLVTRVFDSRRAAAMSRFACASARRFDRKTSACIHQHRRQEDESSFHELATCGTARLRNAVHNSVHRGCYTSGYSRCGDK